MVVARERVAFFFAFPLTENTLPFCLPFVSAVFFCKTDPPHEFFYVLKSTAQRVWGGVTRFVFLIYTNNVK